MSEVALNQVSQEELMRLTGMSNEQGGSGSKNQLPRLRMWHTPLMGVVEVNGKKKKMEVVDAGQYRLEQADGTMAYAPRLMYDSLCSRSCISVTSVIQLTVVT